jgi:hypothetical protein
MTRAKAYHGGREEELVEDTILVQTRDLSSPSNRQFALSRIAMVFIFNQPRLDILRTAYKPV